MQTTFINTLPAAAQVQFLSLLVPGAESQVNSLPPSDRQIVVTNLLATAVNKVNAARQVPSPEGWKQGEAFTSEYAGKSQGELIKLLAIKSGAPVSPKMTVEALIAKLETFDEDEVARKAEAEAEAKATKQAKQAGRTNSPRLGIGAKIVELLKAGNAPAKTLEVVKETWPTAKTTMACVYWYASKIRTGAIA